MPYNLDIPGQVSTFQLRAIELVAKLVPINGKIVEVGSLFGSSSWAWAKSVDPSVKVYCCDPWIGNEGIKPIEDRYGIKYSVEQFKLYTQDCDNIVPMQGFSPKDFIDWGSPIDLYYEDAVHTDPILTTNLDFWTGHLKPEGIICGDDYRPRFPDVRGGAERLAEKYNRELITVDFFWCLLPNNSSNIQISKIKKELKKLSLESDNARLTASNKYRVYYQGIVSEKNNSNSASLGLRIESDDLFPWPNTDNQKPLTIIYEIKEEEAGKLVIREEQITTFTQIHPDIPMIVNLKINHNKVNKEGSFINISIKESSGDILQLWKGEIVL